MSNFETKVTEAAQQALLKIVLEGSWVAPDYANRFKLPPEFMAQCWQLVDQSRLRQQIAHRLESELADRMVNRIAEELATDIKQILGVKERREMLRNLAREHMDAVMQAGTVPAA